MNYLYSNIHYTAVQANQMYVQPIQVSCVQ